MYCILYCIYYKTTDLFNLSYMQKLFLSQNVSNRERGEDRTDIYGMSKVQRFGITSQVQRLPSSYFSLSKLSGRKVNVLLFCTDLWTQPERRNTLLQSWIDGPQPSPEGQLALRRKNKHKKMQQ